jgi:hypothetical protein
MAISDVVHCRGNRYNQVSRILNPVVSTVTKLDELVKDPGVKEYLDRTFGGAHLRM